MELKTVTVLFFGLLLLLEEGFSQEQNGTEKTCITGLRYDESQGCVDINECKEIKNVCSSNEFCINGYGSFICSCKRGFARDFSNNLCNKIPDDQWKLLQTYYNH